MAEFNDFDVEIQNKYDAEPEHFNGSVATAGSPVTITPTNGRDAQTATVLNPRRGPNANSNLDVLLVSVDGGTTYISLGRGDSIRINANITAGVKIDANNNGTNYEVVVVS